MDIINSNRSRFVGYLTGVGVGGATASFIKTDQHNYDAPASSLRKTYLAESFYLW